MPAVDSATAPAVSCWLVRHAGLLRPGGSVLDVACGSGRHVRWLAARGHAVTGVDRDAGALQALARIAETVVADLEGAPWPLPARRFDAVVVTNYLWRPLWPALRASLAPGGVLLCETFAEGQQFVGRPSRPDFLLQPGELLLTCEGLRVVAYEDGWDDAPAPGAQPGSGRYVQRIVAVAEAAPQSGSPGVAPPRYRLPGADA